MVIFAVKKINKIKTLYIEKIVYFRAFILLSCCSFGQ